MADLESELLGEGEEADLDYIKYLNDNIHREEELIQFVDDYLKSEEFEMHAAIKFANEEKEKPQTVKRRGYRCVCTECWEVEEVKLSPSELVKRAKRMWTLEKRLESFAKAKEVKTITAEQERSIAIIRVALNQK